MLLTHPAHFTFLAVVYFFAFIFALLLIRSVRIIKQGSVGVTTLFGKYRRTLQPGLHILIPIVEKIDQKISIQNRTTELTFQAITKDQAQVGFKAMLLWAAVDSSEETIKSIAYKFRSEEELLTALERSVEGETRGIVSGSRQSEVLTIRSEIVKDLQSVLNEALAGWGFKLIDVQINDITFDKTITDSMAAVVASANLLAAADNEGKAVVIKETAKATAEGAKIRISAEAEKDAAAKQGEGVALFRQKSTEGLSEAVKALSEAGLKDAMNMVMFSMWVETLKYAAEKGTGNVIFMDGSQEGFDKAINRMISVELLDNKGQPGIVEAKSSDN